MISGLERAPIGLTACFVVPVDHLRQESFCENHMPTPPTTLASIFQKLTEWKKYPNYQMERRADIFFGFYMNEILSAEFRRKVRCDHA